MADGPLSDDRRPFQRRPAADLSASPRDGLGVPWSRRVRVSRSRGCRRVPTHKVSARRQPATCEGLHGDRRSARDLYLHGNFCTGKLRASLSMDVCRQGLGAPSTGLRARRSERVAASRHTISPRLDTSTPHIVGALRPWLASPRLDTLYLRVSTQLDTSPPHIVGALRP